MELFAKLGIDWRLLLAQIFNFLILLFILYKFLYKPVLKMLHERTEKIEQGLFQAQTIEAKLKQIEEEHLAKIAETRKEAQIIIEEARKEAGRTRQEIVEESRIESQKIIAAGKAQLQVEKESLVKELKKEVAGLAIEATEQLLKDVLNEDIDHMIAEAAVKKFGRA